MSYHFTTRASRLARLAPEHARAEPFGQASSQLTSRASPAWSGLAQSSSFTLLATANRRPIRSERAVGGPFSHESGGRAMHAPRSAPLVCSPHVPLAHGSPRGPRALGGESAPRRRTCTALPFGPATCANRAACDLPLPMAMYGHATHGDWADMMGICYGYDVTSMSGTHRP